MTGVRYAVPAATSDPAEVRHTGRLACAAVGMVLLGFALSVDFPTAAFGFQSDEATYYSLAYSLAEDGDFAYEARDLTRVWREFPSGPQGLFLKRGKDLDIQVTGSFPFIVISRRDDAPADRLYYGKSYIYPLVAAPFVRIFGTNGFLVLHALLMVLALACAYWFLAARAPAHVALLYALGFFGASAAPVYMVWLTPDLFNLSVSTLGLFLWAYKEVAPTPARWLASPRSDLAAAAILAVAAFSKPTNVVLILPIAALGAWRRRWRHAVATTGVFAAVLAGLFLVNLAVTGELNFQGGDRKTFYAGGPGGGFPFQRPEATFETVGQGRATDSVPFDVLFTRDALLRVFPANVWYFLLGRHTGLVPYFFPGVVSLALFLVGAGVRGERPAWQTLVAATFVLASAALLLYMPFTYSGGGGPVGNRYFLGFYPLLLFVTPPLRSVRAPLAALAIGALFTAPLVANPFYTSFHPAEHPKRGPYRWLPVELTLVNDLPINVTPSRVKVSLGGEPPVQAYFLDNNAYDREAGGAFWVRGDGRAELILRAPSRVRPDGAVESLRLAALQVALRAGDVPVRARIRSSADSREVALAAHATQVVSLRMGRGFPYRPLPGHPTNYVYLMSIACDGGFVPMFTAGSRDYRYLGAMVKIEPVYE